MSWTARIAAPTALVAVLVLTGGPAAADPTPTVPPDVAAQFAGDAVRRAQLAAEPGSGADSPDVRAGTVHQLFRFSDDYVAGTPTGEPVVPADSWVASLLHGDEVRGVLWVWKPEGGPAEWQGYADDLELGATLEELGPDQVLIEDPTIGGWYALDGGTIRALNHWAADELPEPTDIAAYQPVVAERVALAIASEEEMASGENRRQVIAMVGVVGIFAVLFGGLVLVDRRRRTGRAAPSS